MPQLRKVDKPAWEACSTPMVQTNRKHILICSLSWAGLCFVSPRRAATSGNLGKSCHIVYPEGKPLQHPWVVRTMKSIGVCEVNAEYWLVWSQILIFKCAGLTLIALSVGLSLPVRKWSGFQDGCTKVSGINFLLDIVCRTQNHEEHLHSHNKFYFYLR